jgi:hypothetical protein
MNIKKILASLVLLIIATSAALFIRASLLQPVMAAGSIYEGITEIQNQTQLPTFDVSHPQASVQSGASNITSAVYYTLDFVKLLIGGVAVIQIFITAIQIIIARKKVDDVWSKQKDKLIILVSAFIIIMIADPVVKTVFFGVQGEVYDSPAQAEAAATAGTELLRGLYNAALMITGVLAVLMIVIAGIKMLVSGGNEEAQTKVKKQITWLAVGLFVLGVAEFVVQEFIFPNKGSEIPDVDKGRNLIVSFTNFASGFVVFASIVVCIYGGYLYVIAVGNEEKTGKAKKTITGAIIAMILAAGAFAIVSTVLGFKPGA